MSEGKYVILNWSCDEDISLAYDQNGIPLVFHDETKAARYAKNNFSWNWQVVLLL